MLDKKDYAIVVATEVLGHAFNEISADWDFPVETLLARKSRTMKKLREAMMEIDSGHYMPLVSERNNYGKS